MKNTIALLSAGILISLLASNVTAMGVQRDNLPFTPSDTPGDVSAIREQHLYDFQHRVPISPLSIYHSYAEMTSLLFSLAENHSDIMRVTSLGKTYQGRDLWLVKLSDNVNQEEYEPEVLFTGSHHGNERPGYETLIYFIQYMADYYHNDTAVRDAINSTEIYVIPMVNPDGVEAGTRKNLEPNHGSFGFSKTVTSIGVDLNRNYAGPWFLLLLRPLFYDSSTSYYDRSDVYRGPHPFSENETQAVRQFVETHNITISIDYHTFDQLILYPWGDTRLPTPDKSLFVSIGENISKLDNYTLEQSTALYPTLGDVCDWMYAKHHILAFTIELGTSYAPENPVLLHKMSVDHTRVNLYICQRAQSIAAQR
ncbi:MAG TPA: M14 family metallopeptidase [Candidatus Thermoplasmatota archaeon]|nr:M14 family metallopeptidase [Candidatus Thermoplasmatota archaeon]